MTIILVVGLSWALFALMREECGPFDCQHDD